MSSALRYDDVTTRLELVTAGQSLQAIMQAFADIKQCLLTCNDIADVLSEPLHTFRQMAGVFSRCRVEKNAAGLCLVLDVISSSMKAMTTKLRQQCIKPLISDIVACLVFPEAKPTAEGLLTSIHTGDAELSACLIMEVEHTLLNCRDADLVEGVKALSSLLLGDSFGPTFGFSPGPTKKKGTPRARERERDRDGGEGGGDSHSQQSLAGIGISSPSASSNSNSSSSSGIYSSTGGTGSREARAGPINNAMNALGAVAE